MAMALAPSPWAAGLRGRCPACGQGPVFKSYLSLREQCGVCGADFRSADAGDGPAVFVILIVGAIAAPLLLVLQMALKLPDWLAVAITSGAVVALCLGLLPVLKASLFALQWKHKAGEATHADIE